VGARLQIESFSGYAKAVAEVCRPLAQWENLRVRLGMDPREILVRCDERVCELPYLGLGPESNLWPSGGADPMDADTGSAPPSPKGTSSAASAESGPRHHSRAVQPVVLPMSHGSLGPKDQAFEGAPSPTPVAASSQNWGTLFVTDRHLVLLVKQNRRQGMAQRFFEGSYKVRVVPLATATAVREERGSIVLDGAKAITAFLSEKTISEPMAASRYQHAGFVLTPLAPGRYTYGAVFGQDTGVQEEERAVRKATHGSRTSRRRQILLETLQELVAAHRLSAFAAQVLAPAFHRGGLRSEPPIEPSDASISTVRGPDAAAAQPTVPPPLTTSTGLRQRWRSRVPPTVSAIPVKPGCQGNVDPPLHSVQEGRPNREQGSVDAVQIALEDPGQLAQLYQSWFATSGPLTAATTTRQAGTSGRVRAPAGVGAMRDTLVLAWKMGIRKLLERGGSPQLHEAERIAREAQERGLVLWAAMNLKRRFALMRVTVRPASGMLFCSLFHQGQRSAAGAEAQRVVHAFLLDQMHLNDHSSGGAGLPPPPLPAPVQPADSPPQASAPPPPGGVKDVAAAAENAAALDWWRTLPQTIRWFTHEASREAAEAESEQRAQLRRHLPSFDNASAKDKAKLSAAYTEAFHASRFRDEWILFTDFTDPFIDNILDVLPGTTCHALVYWESPATTGLVFLLLLAIAWHDMVHLVPSFVLLVYAGSILVTGSYHASLERRSIARVSFGLGGSTPAPSTALGAAAGAAPAGEGLAPNLLRTPNPRGSTGSGGEGQGPLGAGTSGPAPSTTGAATASGMKALFSAVSRATPMTVARSDSGSSNDARSQVAVGTDLPPKTLFSLAQPGDPRSGVGVGGWSVSEGDLEVFDDEQIIAAAAAAAATARLASASGRAPSIKLSLPSLTFPTGATPKPASAEHGTGHGSAWASVDGGQEEFERMTTTGAHASAKDEKGPGEHGETGHREEVRGLQSGGSGAEEGDAPNDPAREAAEESTAAAATPQAAEAPEVNESLLTFMRQMRAHLGRIQLHLHRYNTYFLRFHALQHWKDPASTLVLLAFLVSSALWLSVVPHRISFALWVIYIFTRRFRVQGFRGGNNDPDLRAAAASPHALPQPRGSNGGPGPGVDGPGESGTRRHAFASSRREHRFQSLPDVLLDQWLWGIPLDSPTHRDLPLSMKLALARVAAASSSTAPLR